MVFSVSEIVHWRCKMGCFAAEMSKYDIGQVANGVSGNGDDGWVSCMACKLGTEGVMSV